MSKAIKITLVGIHHHPLDGVDRKSASFNVYCPGCGEPIRDELFLDHLLYWLEAHYSMFRCQCGREVNVPVEPLRTIIHFLPGTALLIHEVRTFKLEPLLVNDPRHPTFSAREQMAVLADRIPAGEKPEKCRVCGEPISKTWAAYHDNRCKACEQVALHPCGFYTIEPSGKRTCTAPGPLSRFNKTGESTPCPSAGDPRKCPLLAKEAQPDAPQA